MSFLSDVGATCIDHGQAGTLTDSCCPGYTPWRYDANAGTPYAGMMCWTAPCAQAGQFAPPSGVGGPGCCSPLVNVNGKCGTASSGGSGGNFIPLPPTPAPSGSIIPGVDNMILYAVAGGLVLLMMMGKKKGA